MARRSNAAQEPWPIDREAAPPKYLTLAEPDVRLDEAWARLHLRVFHGWNSKRVLQGDPEKLLDDHAEQHSAIEWEGRPVVLPVEHTHTLILEAGIIGDETMPRSIRLALLSLVVGVREAVNNGWER